MAHGENIIVYLQDIKWNEPSVSVVIEPEYTALDVVKLIVSKTRQFNHNSYELAEIFVSSGQLCKERRLDMSEIPYKVKGLWPKGGALAPDATYRFYLVRKGGPGGFLRSLSWTDCSHSMDLSLDEYLLKFLGQKTAGENYADLCSLADLNETTLLDNLKQRFYADTVYTYVGTILIAINPFKFFPIYNPKYVAMYQGSAHRIGDLPPHIFAIANAAFTSMLDSQSDQCIVISGESGSGKTENTNFLLHHLTRNKQGQQQNHHGHGVEQTLLGAGPVLEAFGNAKTVHNDNSSRFGKFIQIDFRKNGAVHGASVEKYLLEKSRIVSQATNERNYHVFYYLLNGASEGLTRELFLLKAEEYHYLNHSGFFPTVDEEEEYEKLCRSMEMVGFKPDLQKRIFAVISAILLLGNVEFVKKHTYHHDDAVQVKNIELVTKICKLLDVKEESFMEALTSKRTVAGGETVVVRYKQEDAISARNAMAKCLYGAIFDWIVWQVNHALFQKQDHKDTKSNSIGVLDIFGFEDFTRNSFEQFCINYANEHLQYYFNQHIFKYEQEEYKREKIEWQQISFIDNRRCLDLFAKRPSGLFFLLDEEGNFPGATNDTLLEKFHQNHKNSDFYEMPMRRESTFTVRHYAGRVKYHIQDFREKNSDLIHADLVSVLKNSNTGFVRELVGCDPVAMLRWSYVRLCMKCVNAFIRAGKTFHERGGHMEHSDSAHELIEQWNKIGDIRRKTSVTHKTATREHLHLPWSDNSENESAQDSGSFIHNTAKKAKRKTSARRKKYRDYKQFKTYQEVKNRETSKAKTPSVSLQFQKSLQSLLETLDKSHPYFVRCIKSNMAKTSCKFDDELVRRQLRYTGMLATVRLRQSGYNYRVLFEEFVLNYAALLPNGKDSTREDVDAFLTSMDSNHTYKNFQVGTSKVFLRETVKMLLDDALHHALLRNIIRLQSWVRRIRAQSKYSAMKTAVVNIQRVYRGMQARQEVLPRLLTYREEQRRLAEAEIRRQEMEELRRQRMEIEEQERQQRLKAEEVERQRLLKLERELQQKTVAAQKIQRWYKKYKAIMDAKVKNRADKLTKELEGSSVTQPSDILPTTDIDQLNKSIDAEAPRTLDSPNSQKVESWLDDKVPGINGHDELPSQHSPPSSVSDSTSEKLKEEQDKVTSIEPAASSTRTGEGVIRRTSINRAEAFRRGSAKDVVDAAVRKDKDKVIPVVKRTAPSPSVSSAESSDNRSLITNDVVAQPDLPVEEPTPSSAPPNKEVTTQQLPSAEQKQLVNADMEQPGVVSSHDSHKGHSRACSDQSELISRTIGARPDFVNFRQKSTELRSTNLFYTPESKRPESRHSLPSTKVSHDSSPVNEQQTVETNLPNIVVTERKVPDQLPLNLLTTVQDKSADPTPEGKTPVRRTSSNDPGALRRVSSKSERASDLLSPEAVTPGSSVTRQSSRASSVEDNGELKFTRAMDYEEAGCWSGAHSLPASAFRRQLSLTKSLFKSLTHILRKNIVRKSQSADNLAPLSTADLPELSAEHGVNLIYAPLRKHFYEDKQSSKINGQTVNTSKSQSHDRLTNKENIEGRASLDMGGISASINAANVASAKRIPKIKRSGSEDSDFGENFVSVPLPVPKIKQPARTGSKKLTAKQNASNHNQWSVSSTSEWNYPESLAITESEEISELGKFIYNKYLEFRGVDNVTKSVYDTVFRDAMKEMYNTLLTKSALSLSSPNAFHPVRFRDLMSNFRDYVTANVNKNVSEEEARDFPTPIAINAFRGFLDEFQKKRRPLKRKPPKTKTPKEHKKKPHKEATLTKIKGHHMLPTQFTMPTFCEVCTKMMFWNIRERGCQCDYCNLSCHKKCTAQISTICPNAPPEEMRPNAVFGVPLQMIAGEDNSVPPILDKLIGELDNRGIYTDGIYRKSGVASKAKSLQKALDTDWEAVNLSEYAVHVISLTLKNFFRELPEPLFTFELYNEFIRCCDIQVKDDAISAMRATVDKLPPVNLNTISRLMLHLARIAQNEKTNRMSTNALAIVFAPNLLRTSAPMTAQQSLQQIERQCRTVDMMLEATLKKLNTTLQDLDQLESERQTLENRLSDVRQSMRKDRSTKRLAGVKQPPAMLPHLEAPDPESPTYPEVTTPSSDTQSLNSEPVDMEFVKQEQVISESLRTVHEKRQRLQQTIPRLTLTQSDGDDTYSADDIESSAESLDDIGDS